MTCFIPAGCTGLLQPLDISVNDSLKKKLKRSFSNWYANKVHTYLKHHRDTTGLHVDLKTSTIKPIHARWLIDSVLWLKQQKEKLIHGWRESGILEVVDQGLSA